jgi:hypothetical protein
MSLIAIARKPLADRPARLAAGRVAVLLLASIAMMGCQMLASPEVITGEIDDTQIRLAQDSGPAAVRLELTNVGSTPCELVPISPCYRMTNSPWSMVAW